MIGPATPGQRHSPVAFLVDGVPPTMWGRFSTTTVWPSASGITVHGRCIADSGRRLGPRVVRCLPTLDEVDRTIAGVRRFPSSSSAGPEGLG